MAAQLVEGAHLHGPLASKKCGGCHEPHGNDLPSFVSKPYTGTFYSPYQPEAYALCFSCHDETLATEKLTAGATKFRNGNVNLHYLHVNKARKGRSCRACHTIHASKNPHMLADSVPFGQWQLPIGFKEIEGGGTCTSGCHLPKTYRRVKPAAGVATTKPATKPAKPPATAPAGGSPK
jgi:predicted CXXCH cytochrome family protein